MKTFKEFQEGLFDWLPRGKYKEPTRQDQLDYYQKKYPRSVRGPQPGKPTMMDPNPTRYNMPQPEQQLKPNRPPKPSAKNFFKVKGLEV